MERDNFKNAEKLVADNVADGLMKGLLLDAIEACNELEKQNEELKNMLVEANKAQIESNLTMVDLSATIKRKDHALTMLRTAFWRTVGVFIYRNDRRVFYSYDKKKALVDYWTKKAEELNKED